MCKHLVTETLTREFKMGATKSRSTVYINRDVVGLRTVLVLYSATRCLKTTENKI